MAIMLQLFTKIININVGLKKYNLKSYISLTKIIYKFRLEKKYVL